MNKYKCKSNYKKVDRFNLHVDTGSWIRFKISIYILFIRDKSQI